MRRFCLPFAFSIVALPMLYGQVLQTERPQSAASTNQSTNGWSGPVKDVTYQIIWLIESDDQNRSPYVGPARNGLDDSGFGRLVPAGSLQSTVTVGQKSSAIGASRYGTLTASATFLNTTDGRLQVKIDLKTQTPTPIELNTTARAPIDRWFLLSAVGSRVGQATHDASGKRSVMIMKLTEGVQVLD